MIDPILQRALVLYLPLLGLIGLVLWRKPDRRWGGGLLLSFGWSVISVVALTALASRLGWWTLVPRDHLWLGVPVDLLIGWAVFWGPLPALAFPRRPLAAAAAVFWLDLILMPALGGVLNLGGLWVVGEVAGIVLCMVPAFLIAEWTKDRVRLAARVAAQVAIFGGLNLMVVVAVLQSSEPGWLTAGIARWELWVQALAVPAVLASAAVSEFKRSGEGTPFPYDPPLRQVAGGPYAYVANPMQLAMTAGFFILSALSGSIQLALAGAVAAMISSGIAKWHEEAHLEERFGEDRALYRAVVKRWIPNWQPVWARLSDNPECREPSNRLAPSTLYISQTCPLCSPVGSWIAAKGPAGLEILPAESLNPPPLRALYVPAEGSSRQGVAALAKSMEHIHLGWALAGWVLQLPGVSALVQLIADAVGAGPREITAVAKGV